MQQRYANAWYRLFYVKLTTLVCARIQEFAGFSRATVYARKLG